MQGWRPVLLILVLALLLVACGPSSVSQALRDQAAQPPPVAKHADPTATSGVSVIPSTIVSTSSAAVPNDPPDTCPVTTPPNPPFIPPPPYPPTPPYGGFWYGTEALWKDLPTDGTWPSLHTGDKVFWWRQGYDWRAEPEPKLTVTGRRLDAQAPPFVVLRATNGYHEALKSFMLVGLNLPTAGCWEITGNYKGDELSFVVWVAP